MEGVEGLMRNLQLSAAKKKGLRIGPKGKAKEQRKRGLENIVDEELGDAKWSRRSEQELAVPL
ncbi:hypothetical protein C2845_PM11G10370 [Panicum miliaceum]|uniref:Uncharacterized protein n=1 Tax=Panicum miliaceum TaxID=4540 RepID=A0A3L6RPR1_PANMI|nr:hypothetical protein C2845_PM11G10370 [Panicum miliaceum]